MVKTEVFAVKEVKIMGIMDFLRKKKCENQPENIKKEEKNAVTEHIAESDVIHGETRECEIAQADSQRDSMYDAEDEGKEYAEDFIIEDIDCAQLLIEVAQTMLRYYEPDDEAGYGGATVGRWLERLYTDDSFNLADSIKANYNNWADRLPDKDSLVEKLCTAGLHISYRKAMNGDIFAVSDLFSAGYVLDDMALTAKFAAEIARAGNTFALNEMANMYDSGHKVFAQTIAALHTEGVPGAAQAVKYISTSDDAEKNRLRKEISNLKKDDMYFEYDSHQESCYADAVGALLKDRGASQTDETPVQEAPAEEISEQETSVPKYITDQEICHTDEADVLPEDTDNLQEDKTSAEDDLYAEYISGCDNRPLIPVSLLAGQNILQETEFYDKFDYAECAIDVAEHISFNMPPDMMMPSHTYTIKELVENLLDDSKIIDFVDAVRYNTDGFADKLPQSRTMAAKLSQIYMEQKAWLAMGGEAKDAMMMVYGGTDVIKSPQLTLKYVEKITRNNIRCGIGFLLEAYDRGRIDRTAVETMLEKLAAEGVRGGKRAMEYISTADEERKDYIIEKLKMSQKGKDLNAIRNRMDVNRSYYLSYAKNMWQ